MILIIANLLSKSAVSEELIAYTEQFIAHIEQLIAPPEQFIALTEQLFAPLEQFIALIDQFIAPIEQFIAPIDPFSFPEAPLLKFFRSNVFRSFKLEGNLYICGRKLLCFIEIFHENSLLE